MADRYWRGGTGTWNTSLTTNWSATSGGAGGATWYAGPTSTNTSNNTGWVFTQLPIINMGNLTVADGGFVISNNPVV